MSVVPFSQVRYAGGLGFMSGLTATESVNDHGVVSFASQCRDVLNHLKEIVASQDATMADVVNVHVYLVDARHFDEMNSIYIELFEEPFPTRTTLIVQALARPENLIEIDAVFAGGEK